VSNRIYINKDTNIDGWWNLLINKPDISAHRIAKEFAEYQIEKIFVDEDSIELYNTIKQKICLAIIATHRTCESFNVFKRHKDDTNEIIDVITI